MSLSTIGFYLSRVTIEPVVLLYVFAIFAEYAVIEDLLYVSKCFNYLNLTSDDQLHICIENKKHKGSSNGTNDDVWKEISAATNNALLIYNGILYSTSIVSSFVAAAYADRRSKLWPILIPVIGSAIVQLIILIALTIETSAGISLIVSHSAVIFVCCFISGITGGTSTLLSNCFAFVAERCSGERRTIRITIVEACLFGGGFFAFTYAGAIMRQHPNSLLRYYYNFGIYFAIHISLAIYILLRRTLFAMHDRSRTNLSSPNSDGFVLLATSVLRTIFRKRTHRRQRTLILLILAAFTLISFWNVAITTLMFIYTRNEPLQWPSWMYSYFSSAKFALCGLFLCLLPLLQYSLREYFARSALSDFVIIVIGLISRGLAIILIGLATSTVLMIAGLVAIVLAEYPIPAIRSLISKIIESNEKAQVFVFMAMIQSICFFLGGMIFPAIYNAILSGLKDSSELIGGFFNGPGLIFVVLGVLQFIAIGIFMYVDRVMSVCNLGPYQCETDHQTEAKNSTPQMSTCESDKLGSQQTIYS